MCGRWDEAIATFPPNVHSRMINGITTFISERAYAERVEAFILAHPIVGEERNARQLLERLHIGLDFADFLPLMMLSMSTLTVVFVPSGA